MKKLSAVSFQLSAVNLQPRTVQIRGCLKAYDVELRAES
jgi:hypothetical protein